MEPTRRGPRTERCNRKRRTALTANPPRPQQTCSGSPHARWSNCARSRTTPPLRTRELRLGRYRNVSRPLPQRFGNVSPPPPRARELRPGAVLRQVRGGARHHHARVRTPTPPKADRKPVRRLQPTHWFRDRRGVPSAQPGSLASRTRPCARSRRWTPPSGATVTTVAPVPRPPNALERAARALGVSDKTVRQVKKVDATIQSYGRNRTTG